MTQIVHYEKVRADEEKYYTQGTRDEKWNWVTSYGL